MESNNIVLPIEPENLLLYHGSMGIKGNSIEIHSNEGVGWNSLTLGDAFYTSPCLDASKLFSHMVLVKNNLMGGEREENMGFAKVYQIKLNNDIKILDAGATLDANVVRGVLLYAGVPEKYLNFRNDDQLEDFYKFADLLCYGFNWEGNRNEYLTKALGYDALMIRERAWQDWDYFPDDIGIDWDNTEILSEWPPKTLAIYHPQKISGFELYINGMIKESENQIDSSNDSLSR